MREDSRGRLTVPDVAYALFSLAVLRALYPVWNDLFVNNLSAVNTAEAWLLRLILPFALLVMFAMIYRKATAGVA